MQRVVSAPRADWQAQVESLGLTYHTIDGELYWDESAHYRFPYAEILRLERATEELQPSSPELQPSSPQPQHSPTRHALV
jgi:glutathionylspermidine synthase